MLLNISPLDIFICASWTEPWKFYSLNVDYYTDGLLSLRSKIELKIEKALNVFISNACYQIVLLLSTHDKKVKN